MADVTSTPFDWGKLANTVISYIPSGTAPATTVPVNSQLQSQTTNSTISPLMVGGIALIAVIGIVILVKR